MKNVISRPNRVSLTLAILFSAFTLAGIGQALAYDDHGDRNGFRDQGGNYHRYGYHHHHRGYWNQGQSGVRLWINA
jgi:hypothetical protein